VAGTTGAAGTTGQAGTSGTAGISGRAGTSGTAGTIGRGGTTGTAGTAGTSGAAGTTGAAGASGTGPCTGLCSDPMEVAIKTNSPNFGTGTVCDDVVGTAITHVVCGNFVTPRTFTVNGTAISCYSPANGGALPAPRNGGFCMQASAGDFSYAYFTTY
jgi:hypothetical protein